MASNESSSGSGWLGFLAGIVLLAIVGIGIVAYTGALQPRQTAQLELNVPDVKVNPPDVTLPSPPPAPSIPPAAEAPAPAPQN
jgi:hypothetical protein